MSASAEALRTQWSNPADILSILLLIGGDIVQKAIAQLVGHEVRLPGTRTYLSIAPVAFSFGWVSYGFSNLLAAAGNMRLMPPSDLRSIVVNCSNGFVRENHSWVLGRLLRDHEMRHHVDPRSTGEGGRAESIRIDIFHLGSRSSPSCDAIWWLGWATLVTQIIIAIIPGVFYGDWAIILVTLSGTTFAAVTCALPQWAEEKWATSSKLAHDKVFCLTRGNGHLHIMVFIGSHGSQDLEVLATRTMGIRAETRWISFALAILWICLLITMSGLKDHTWFLISIGGLGMLQNILAAGVSREPRASNFHLTKFRSAPTIIGRRQNYTDDTDANVNLEEDLQGLSHLDAWASKEQRPRVGRDDGLPPLRELSPMPRWMISMSEEDGVPSWLKALRPDRVQRASSAQRGFRRFKHYIRGLYRLDTETTSDVIYAVGVHGALMELEKWVPTAGLSMLQIFFPAGLQYHDEAIRDNVHKKFWKRAYHTRSIRRKAGQKRLADERKRGGVR